jgi:hypothetical protein
MILLVLINGGLQILYDRISVNDGFAWDGVLYGQLAIDFEGTIRGGGYGMMSERAQRILPSAVVYIILTVTGIARTHQNIVMAFTLWNLGLLVASVVCWDRIADTLGLGPSGRWLGFLGLFVNFGTAKWPFYCPVMTDTTAFFLGMLLCLAYLRGSLAGLVAVMVAAAFTWSTLGYLCLPLMAFLRPVRVEQGEAGAARNLAAVVAALAYAAGACYWIFLQPPKGPALEALPPTMSALVRPLGYLVAIAAGAIYLFLGLRPLVDVNPARFVGALRAALSVRGLALGVIIIVAARVVALMISSAPTKISGPYSGYSAIAAVLWMIVTTHGKPLLFVVSNVVFLGPLILLMVCYWRTIAQTVVGHGPGAMLLVAAAICISLNPEPRYLLPVYPFLVAMTAQTLDKVQLSRSFYVFFAVASYIVSKVWLRIDIGISDAPLVGPHAIKPLEFPWQWHAMNEGLFMSAAMYLVQGILTLAIAVVMWQLMQRAPVRAGEGSDRTHR